MSKNLLIVESPAKGKTLKKYLGKDFDILASYGHVRDLVPKEGAVDPENDFKMKYEVIDRNEKHVAAIGKALLKADALYLATDPDREGEAISWHLYELLKQRKKVGKRPVYRVVFHEITQRAVKDAVANPRELSIDLVNAQQARRALDYLVGFNLSPLLWKKIKRGLSAGRVQSPALRMLVEREMEIQEFKSQEYWTIEADANKDNQPFSAKLNIYRGRKLEQFDITTQVDATAAKKALLEDGSGKLLVSKIEKKQRRRNPAAPFTTSTLQQEAVRKLRFSTRRTMRIAQQLYEGIDLGAGPVGLITYMRTDSVALAGEAVNDIRALITKRYGPSKLPAQARRFKTKAKNAQEAHEAIRPTSAHQLPEQVAKYLSTEQRKLYDLIWKRSIACQMIHATLDTVAVDLACGDPHSFRATGSTVREAGFMVVYQEGSDEKKLDSDEKRLPPLVEGEHIQLLDIRTEQHFTEPPPRYTEATLVKTLEEYGIGRPSTYASIISTLQDRDYAVLESRRFHPTDIGRVVNNFLTEHFTRYVDYDFTAHFEDELDDISRGEKDWLPIMREFWRPFKTLIEEKDASVSRDEAVQARELGMDPSSGKPMTVRMGRYGPFVQIGTRDDEDKPRFAGLRQGQNMDSITLEEALVLFKLPRKLGKTDDDQPVEANIGRFGPYVKYGKQYVSIKNEDPHTITLDQALELIKEKQTADANRVIQQFTENNIQVLNGRYGPYITDGKKNARIPKDSDPAALTLEECEQLLAKAPNRKPRRRAAPKKKRRTSN
ncbi:MAG: DNA topoisomerase I [Gammaproteobacteria bacterium]|nr:DNA topoisomerase I [Gammaproteobacteria bacterium]